MSTDYLDDMDDFLETTEKPESPHQKLLDVSKNKTWIFTTSIVDKTLRIQVIDLEHADKQDIIGWLRITNPSLLEFAEKSKFDSLAAKENIMGAAIIAHKFLQDAFRGMAGIRR